jgi:glycosyltransferase involved in cell wall biosynthesis
VSENLHVGLPNNEESNSPRLSLAIIALNEAENIERCIRSVPIAIDVVVIDSGSRDETVAIATRCGARVVQHEWLGFRDTKRLATEQCQHDWVLSLDADEALSPEALAEVKSVLADPNLDNFDGFVFPRLSWNLGRWMRHGGWYPDWQLRLYHRRRSMWEGGEHVHERVQAERIRRLNHPITHWPFAELAEQVETNNRYSTLGARESVRRRTRFSLGKLIFKPVFKFLETYLIKGGFRDGLPGFIVAVGAAYSVFLKFAKLWELEQDSFLSQNEKKKAAD